jgi:hypothetical protein
VENNFGYFLNAACEPLRVLCNGSRKNFDGYFAIQLCVAGRVNFAHAARADLREDFVGSEPVTRHSEVGQ